MTIFTEYVYSAIPPKMANVNLVSENATVYSYDILNNIIRKYPRVSIWQKPNTKLTYCYCIPNGKDRIYMRLIRTPSADKLKHDWSNRFDKLLDNTPSFYLPKEDDLEACRIVTDFIQTTLINAYWELCGFINNYEQLKDILAYDISESLITKNQFL